MQDSIFGELFSLAGKTAVVTGGASGLGAMAAEALVRAGARVIISSRKEEAGAEFSQRLNALDGPGYAEAVVGDIGSESGALRLAGEIEMRCDQLHILINNAGRAWGAPFGSAPYCSWEKVFAVNLFGAFAFTQQLAPLLSASATPEDPARIVNLGSVSGLLTSSGHAHAYGASKAALHHLTRVLANELAARSICVNALAPGVFHTAMTDFGLSGDADRQRVAASIPLGRLGRPSDVAAAFLFFCGRGGSFVTGVVLPLDGGLSVSCSPKVWEDA